MDNLEQMEEVVRILRKAEGDGRTTFVGRHDEIILWANLKGLCLSDFRRLRELGWYLTKEYGDWCLRMWGG